MQLPHTIPQYHGPVRPITNGYWETTGNIRVWHERKA